MIIKVKEKSQKIYLPSFYHLHSYGLYISLPTKTTPFIFHPSHLSLSHFILFPLNLHIYTCEVHKEKEIGEYA